jgi:hypothetical protein
MFNTLVLHQIQKKVSRLDHIRTVKNSDTAVILHMAPIDSICRWGRQEWRSGVPTPKSRMKPVSDKPVKAQPVLGPACILMLRRAGADADLLTGSIPSFCFFGSVMPAEKAVRKRIECR